MVCKCLWSVTFNAGHLRVADDGQIYSENGELVQLRGVTPSEPETQYGTAVKSLDQFHASSVFKLMDIVGMV